MAERLGKHTILLPTKPSVIGFASVVGKAEGEGPLSKEFDKVYDDDTIDATVQTSLLPDKNIELSITFDGDEFDGFVKIPFLLILNFLRNPYTEVPWHPLFSFC